MPAFHPSILISDAYGSVGDVTFYHRGGKCFYRKRSESRYPGTETQLSALAVHRRALAAWRTVPQEVQQVWNAYGEEAEPHKPPFDHKAHISGQNLFVSAYHGFANLGNEHVPLPQRFASFPPFAVMLRDAAVVAGKLVIPAEVTISKGLDAGRYRMLAKLQLTEPGKGRHPGLMRNVLADKNCGDGQVSLIVPDYINICGFDLDEYQVHCRFLLLDTLTGYRSHYQEQSICLKAKEGISTTPASPED